MKKLFVASVLSSLICPGVEAATWFVAKTGSDSNSCVQAQSSSTSKLTIGAALSCIGTAAGAGAGDFVEVAAGTYAETLTNSIPLGTSWTSPFTLRVRAGDSVTIKPSGSGSVIHYDGSGAKFAIIQGFILDGLNVTSGSGVVEFFGSVSSIRMQSNEIKNATICGPTGSGVSNSLIYMDNTTDIEILNNKIHDGSCGHGIYIEGNNNLVKGNEIYNLNRYGIHNYSSIPGRYPSNNVYDANYLHDTGKDDSIVHFAILLSTGNNNRASNNLVINNQEGINVTGGSGNLVYNNTLYGNGVGHAGQCCYQPIRINNDTNTVVKNNVVFGNQLTGIDSTGSTGATLSNNLFTDPSFVNPGANNFRLQPGSSAIDAGTTLTVVSTDYDNIARPQGSAFDIGAYEYANGSLPPNNLRVVSSGP